MIYTNLTKHNNLPSQTPMNKLRKLFLNFKANFLNQLPVINIIWKDNNIWSREKNQHLVWFSIIKWEEKLLYGNGNRRDSAESSLMCWGFSWRFFISGWIPWVWYRNSNAMHYISGSCFFWDTCFTPPPNGSQKNCSNLILCWQFFPF